MSDASIFLIDDSQDDRDLIAIQLRQGQNRNALVMIDSGERAFEIFDQIALGTYPDVLPALIILDLNLVNISGLDVLHKIRTIALLDDVPVMVLTGRQDYVSGISAPEMQPLIIIRKGTGMLDVKHFFDAILELKVGWLLVGKDKP